MGLASFAHTDNLEAGLFHIMRAGAPFNQPLLGQSLFFCQFTCQIHIMSNFFFSLAIRWCPIRRFWAGVAMCCGLSAVWDLQAILAGQKNNPGSPVRPNCSQSGSEAIKQAGNHSSLFHAFFRSRLSPCLFACSCSARKRTSFEPTTAGHGIVESMAPVSSYLQMVADATRAQRDALMERLWALALGPRPNPAKR
jgi:hypothetical protein